MNQSTQTTGRSVRRTAGAASVAALVVALVGAAASPATAQDPPPPLPCGGTDEAPNTICGFVTNGAGGPGIGGVTVIPTGDGGDPVTTDSSGFYTINVGAGDWTVAVDVTTIPVGFGSVVTPPATVHVASNSDIHPNVNFTVSSGSGEDVESDLVPAPCDFVTSGGFVVNDAGKKVSFGAHGGCKNGEFWGHVNVVDHSTGYHINSDEITGFLAPFPVTDPTTRDICGWASTNANSTLVRFRVRLTDNGEPGSLDTLGIVLGAPASYEVTPRLLSAQKPGGGNVQLHKPNPSTTAPNPLPTDLCGGVVFTAP